MQSALIIPFNMITQSISLVVKLNITLFLCVLEARTMRVLNIQWCNGNKRKISLKVDTPRIVCYAPGYSERKAAAGQRSRG